MTSDDIPDRFICSTCGQVFMRARDLIAHVDAHRKACKGDCKGGKK